MILTDSRYDQPVCGVQEEFSDPMSAMSGEVIELMNWETGEKKEKERNKAGLKLRDPEN